MRLKEYLIEKTTKKEFETVLKKNNVLCGCEFEFYFEGDGISVSDIDEWESLLEEADREAKEMNKVLSEYYKEIGRTEDKIFKLEEEIEKINKRIKAIEDIIENSDRDTSAGEREIKKLQKKIGDLEYELDEKRIYLNEGIWEEYREKLPWKYTMPSYYKLLENFSNEFDINPYHQYFGNKYTNFEDLCVLWIEEGQVDYLENVAGLTIREVINEFSPNIISSEEIMNSGFPFNVNSYGWDVKPDGSLGDKGVEIVTPIVPLKELLNIIEKTFDWIDENGFTDRSCGFHVHMSMDKSKYELDPLKLLLFVEEGKIYEYFEERLFNNYCKSIENVHFSNLEMPFNPEDLKKIAKKEKIEKEMNTEKYAGVHLIELEQNHVEFRYMGGKNYHTKFKEVRNVIVNYAYWLSVSCDPDFKKNEYLTKLSRLSNKYNYLFLNKVINWFLNRSKDVIKDYREKYNDSKKAFDETQKIFKMLNKKKNDLPKPKKNYDFHFKGIDSLVDRLINQIRKKLNLTAE